ncbi:MAG: TetR family transcriptional regulator [Thalassospira sp.]|uniref:TetR/AcrR family transcriptional regulator n=1 Tax=Thalassospira sp. UBA4513 TaxID=1947675 RepID=UPI000C3F9FFA|nr:TetR/AcrR family transcriptional regulator [Thalassospira sp. UBA4513]MBE69185.1 TetR family transcriptional regulator [Thalassospira sp.]|tara:strand:+ start:81 stop:701 length:621 start_codon:yes stop_codon:yes gene_type:complete
MNIRAARREETRQKILDAARDCFCAGEFDTVSTREIAKRAGVAEGTIFNHFPTKEDLLICCVGQQMAEAIEKGLYTMDPEWCFVDKMMHVASYRFTQVGLNPGLWQVIMQQIVFSPRKGAVHAVMESSGLIAAIQALIEEAQLSGELNRDLPPVLIQKTLMSLFLFTIHEHFSTQNFDCEDMCGTLRELLEVQVRGLWASEPHLAA